MLVDIYCDESRQDLLVNKEAINSQNRYVCFGGVWVPREYRKILKLDIKALKEKYGINKEFKWGNVSNNKIDFYTELIDLFFDEKYEKVQFRCLVVDAIDVDDDKYNDSDHELGYYKFYYQLLHNWLLTEGEYYIFTDYKTNKEKNRLNKLRAIVNNSMRGEYVKILQAIDSKESLILQWQNILMGTVAYKFNLGTNGCSDAKKKLVEYIENKLGRNIAHTPKTYRKFNVFKISLKGGK